MFNSFRNTSNVTRLNFASQTALGDAVVVILSKYMSYFGTSSSMAAASSGHNTNHDQGSSIASISTDFSHSVTDSHTNIPSSLSNGIAVNTSVNHMNNASNISSYSSGITELISGILNIQSSCNNYDILFEYVALLIVNMCQDRIGQHKLGSSGVCRVIMTCFTRYDKSLSYSSLLSMCVAALAYQFPDNQIRLGQFGACRGILVILERHLVLNNNRLFSVSGNAALSSNTSATSSYLQYLG